MNPSPPVPFRANKRTGFSLVELMISLTLGVVVTGGLVQLFVDSARTYTLVSGQSRMQESARYALEFISGGARSAGHIGCAPEMDNIVRGLRGNWGLIPEFNLTLTVEGFEGNDDGTWTPPLTSLPRTEGGTNWNVHTPGNGIDTNVITPGTDVVVFRTVQYPGQRLMTVLQPDGDPVVTAPGGDPGFGIGDVVLVSDCEQGAMIRVTGMNVAGNQATLLHATAATGSFYENSSVVDGPVGTIPFTLSFLGHSYGEEASVGAVRTTIFFIAPSTAVDSQGNNPSSLWQKEGIGAPVELVSGVDDLEIHYGIDTTLADGILNVNRYVDFDDVPDPAQIVAVRSTVSLSSVEAVTDDGQQLRRTISKTVLIRNAQPEA